MSTPTGRNARTVSILVVVAAAAVAVAALAGAGSAHARSTAKLKSILFVNPLPKYPAWREIGDCVAKQAKSLGIPETESGPTNGTLDTTVMIQQVQQGIANKSGAIITFPATDGFTPVLKQARKAGIVVGTLYGGAGTQKGSDVNVGANFAEEGRIYAKAIAARRGQQHVGLMAQGPTGAAKAWLDAFKRAAKKTKNVTVSGVVYTNDDASKALDAANALLTAHPDINVIASHMGTATSGATAAIKSKHLVGKVVFVANGIAGGGAQGLKDGTIYRAMMQDLCTAGRNVVKAVAKVSAGKKVPAQIDVGIRMFTKSNYKKFAAKGWQ